jgi:hypothetical protein
VVCLIGPFTEARVRTDSAAKQLRANDAPGLLVSLSECEQEITAQKLKYIGMPDSKRASSLSSFEALIYVWRTYGIQEVYVCSGHPAGI